jgi:hypothetical protein
MNDARSDLIAAIVKLFWTVLVSIVPAVMLGNDFGLSVGVGYFVIAAAIVSIQYDAKDMREELRKLRK